LAPASHYIQQALGAGVTPEVFIEMRMSILRRMTAFGVRLISGTDAGIARIKAHGNYADAVIELGQLTGTLPALVAASSSAAAAIGLGRSKGRLRRGTTPTYSSSRATWPPTSPPCGMYSRFGCVPRDGVGR
jgi:imidazolonepropionase-like amidohydrolase